MSKKTKSMSQIMADLKTTRKFNGKTYRLSHHEHYGTKKRAEKDANYYRKRGNLARVVNRGHGKFSIYFREKKE